MQCIHRVDVPNPHNGPGRRGPRTRKRGPPSSPPSGPHRPASHPPQISGMTAKVIMSSVMFSHFMLRVTDEAGRDQCQRPDCPGENRRPVLPDGRPVPGPRARAARSAAGRGLCASHSPTQPHAGGGGASCRLPPVRLSCETRVRGPGLAVGLSQGGHRGCS